MNWITLFDLLPGAIIITIWTIQTLKGEKTGEKNLWDLKFIYVTFALLAFLTVVVIVFQPAWIWGHIIRLIFLIIMVAAYFVLRLKK
ncbi:MAG: hypothetical protein FWE33_03025 [Defluviitaleaceae bacterium]|nr:hypothetical protein [Defluviitaleaceae bacterium]